MICLTIVIRLLSYFCLTSDRVILPSFVKTLPDGIVATTVFFCAYCLLELFICGLIEFKSGSTIVVPLIFVIGCIVFLLTVAKYLRDFSTVYATPKYGAEDLMRSHNSFKPLDRVIDMSSIMDKSDTVTEKSVTPQVRADGFLVQDSSP